MKKLIILIATLMTTLSNAQVKWAVDHDHSSIDFVVSLLGIVEVPGYFEEFEITGETGENFENPTFVATIQTKSINTKVEERNEHLRTSDFFDAKKFPNIKFVSKSYQKIDKKKIRVVGDITIKGITKEIVFLGMYNGMLRTKESTKVGLKLEGNVSLKTFKIGEDPDIGEEVKITINLQLLKV